MPSVRRRICTLAAVAAATLGVAVVVPAGAATPQPRGVLSGQVTDASDAPLADAVVRVLDTRNHKLVGTVHTPSNGRFRFVEPVGPYALYVTGLTAHGGNSDATGYVLAVVKTQAVADGATERHVVLRPGGAVSGHVADTRGHPLKGVVAYIEPVEPYVYPDSSGPIFISFSYAIGGAGLTHADGRFTVRGVPAGVYLVCYDASGHPVSGGTSDASGYLRTCTQTSVIVSARHEESASDVALAGGTGGGLAGVIRDAAGHPMPGATVEATRSGSGYPEGYAFTDRQGRFTMLGVHPGTFTICSEAEPSTDRARTGSARTCRSNVVVSEGSTTSTSLDLRLGGVVSGVIRAENGQPVIGAVVRTGLKGGRTDVTDALGRFRIDGVLPGTHAVCTSARGARVPGSPGGALSACRSQSIVVAAGVVHGGVTQNLHVAGAITGTVRSDDGSPIANAELFAYSRHHFGFAESGSDGGYVIGSLVTDDYVVCAASEQAQQVYCSPQRVHVERPKVTSGADLTVRTPPATTAGVSVSVRDEDGHPLAGVDEVLLRACGNDFCSRFPAFDPAKPVTIAASWITDAEGVVTFRGLEPGTYAACAMAYHAATADDTSRTGYADTCTELTIVATNGTTVEASQVVPPGGVVTGVVTDADGNPIRQAYVHVTGSPADDASPDPDEFSPIQDNFTAADGTFRITGVRSGDAKVCVSAQAADGPNAAGYIDQCLPDPVTVVSAQTTTVAPIRLVPAGEITGTVGPVEPHHTDAVLAFSGVDDFDDPYFADVEQDGSYAIDHLAPGTYRVCFLVSGNTYGSECYDDVPWDPRRELPPLEAAAPIPVGAGEVVTHVDATFAPR